MGSLAVALAGVIAALALGLLALVAYLIPRREKISDRYDDARNTIDKLLNQGAEAQKAHGEQVAAFIERVHGLEDEREMALGALEDEKRARKGDKAALEAAERHRDALIAAIRKGGGEPSVVADLVRDELRVLQNLPKASGPPPAPGAPTRGR